MEPQISFSEYIKNEILEYNWEERQLEILFYSFLRTNGTMRGGTYKVTTSLIKWEKKFNELFLKFYGVKVTPIRTKTLIKYTITDPIFNEKFTSQFGELVINSLEDNKAYIAGAFIGKGWLNKPSSRFYHCELRVRNLAHSLDIQEAFDGIGIKTITINKNKWFYTYIKKAADISNLIRAVNASQSLMFFEDSRIERDFVATFKKMESIENYNFKKTYDTSEKQIKAIKKLKKMPTYNSLKKEWVDLMELRIEKPLYSLSELEMEFNKRHDTFFSKSTINNWLNNIIKISMLGEEKND